MKYDNEKIEKMIKDIERTVKWLENYIKGA
jgi:hypothetical protein